MSVTLVRLDKLTRKIDRAAQPALKLTFKCELLSDRHARHAYNTQVGFEMGTQRAECSTSARLGELEVRLKLRDSATHYMSARYSADQCDPAEVSTCAWYAVVSCYGAGVENVFSFDMF